MNNISIKNEVTVNSVNNSNSNGINTIPAEYQALGFIQGLLCRQIDPQRITMRDARSYCAILLDDNNRKTLCRLFLENDRKKIEFPKIEKSLELKTFSELKKAKSPLFEVIGILEPKETPAAKEPLSLPEPEPDQQRAIQNAADIAHAHAVADFYEDNTPEPEPEPVAIQTATTEPATPELTEEQATAAIVELGKDANFEKAIQAAIDHTKEVSKEVQDAIRERINKEVGNAFAGSHFVVGSVPVTPEPEPQKEPEPDQQKTEDKKDVDYLKYIQM